MKRIDSRGVRARVWRTGRGRHATWHYAVKRPDGGVVLYDNTGSWQPILQTATISVEVLRHMMIAGHPLPVYALFRESGDSR